MYQNARDMFQKFRWAFVAVPLWTDWATVEVTMSCSYRRWTDLVDRFPVILLSDFLWFHRTIRLLEVRLPYRSVAVIPFTQYLRRASVKWVAIWTEMID